MHSITIDNEKYVKATDIARELGYTADYVGQLCRAKKVDAQLVGRSWYVSEDSIKSHKKNRYRSTAKKDKEHIAAATVSVADSDDKGAYPIRVSYVKPGTENLTTQPTFYSRAKAVPASVYLPDESDLIPTTPNKKSGVLKVQLGDARPVRVRTHSKEFDFEPEARQQLRFKGSVQVRAVYDGESELETQAEVSKITSEKKLSAATTIKHNSSVRNNATRKSRKAEKKYTPAVKTSKIKVKHLRRDRKKTNTKHLPLEHNTSGVIGMRTETPAVEGGTLTVPVSLTNEPVLSSSHTYFLYISATVSLLLAFFMIGMQASVFSQGSESSLSYTFTFNNLLATVSYFR